MRFTDDNDGRPTRAPDGEMGQFYFWLGSDAEVADADLDADTETTEDDD